MTETTHTDAVLTDWNEIAVEHYAATEREDWEIEEDLATLRVELDSDYIVDRIAGDIRRVTTRLAERDATVARLEVERDTLLHDLRLTDAALNYACQEFVDIGLDMTVHHIDEMMHERETCTPGSDTSEGE